MRGIVARSLKSFGGIGLERGVGALAVLGYVLSTSLGDPYDFLWSCHVGLVLVGIGLFVPGPRMSAVAFLWVVLGFSLWGLDVLNGRTVDGLTLVVHWGGLLLACFGVWRRGWPQAWIGWVPILGYLALQHGCRFVTPPELNVNLAFGVRAGWEGNFDAYWPYWGLVVSGGSAFLLASEFAARRLIGASAEAALEPATVEEGA